MLPQNMPAYIEAVRRARDEYPDMDIILGIEMDYLGIPRIESSPRTTLSLSSSCSVRSTSSIAGVPTTRAQRGRWLEPGAPDAIWRRYYELWCRAASDASLPFHVMSHPDLPKKFDYYPAFDLSRVYDEAAEAARPAGA